ncbi:MAG: hypothetical protein FWG29_01890 [Treponema sp.]|nr:hypothetical protein [Treponema sp.]
MGRNVIAPNAEAPTALVKLVAKWDYQRAVDRIAPKVARWHGLTADLVRELYIARKHLNGQKGQRTDPDAEDYIRYTWNDFCEAIGISRQTANGFIRRFIPAELSENGEDKLYSQEEWKMLTLTEAPLTTREEERLIARFMHTGVRPEGFTKGLEKIACERLSAKKNKEIAELWKGSLHLETKRDYLADIQLLTKTKSRFQLKDQEQLHSQILMFRAIHGYLESFKKMPDLLAAASNLTGKIHDVTNILAENLADEETAGET